MALCKWWHLICGCVSLISFSCGICSAFHKGDISLSGLVPPLNGKEHCKHVFPEVVVWVVKVLELL